MKFKKKNLVSVIVALSLVCVLAVGLISAYFTDVETQTNVFTVGKIDIDLQEPNWDEPTDILPEQEFPKDPQITNVGVNDAYVFMEVEVPYANVVTVADDGTKNAMADTELFTYEINDGWVAVGEGVKNEDKKTVTYIYAYGSDTAMTALVKDATTETLFDTIKFVNIADSQGIEGTVQNVVVNAYAIQTTNINVDEISPASIWAVVSK